MTFTSPRSVAITGASGFVGRALIDALRSTGRHVVALTRDPGKHAFPADVEARRFDPNEATPNPAAFEGADAVVNLSGETVDGRWTTEKKRHIEASRVDGTKSLVASLAAGTTRPRVLVSASAVGYYGDRGDEPLTERSQSGNDFLAGVVSSWEAAAREAEKLGIRTVMLRTGIVLGDGGALSKMKLPSNWASAARLVRDGNSCHGSISMTWQRSIASHSRTKQSPAQ